MFRFKMGYCSVIKLLINTYSTRLKLYVVFVLMMSLGFSSYGQNTPKHSSKVFFSIHSNLLYDAALIPNVGAEIYLGKSLSLQANWHYAWWKIEKKNKFWQTYGGDITLRYWFGSTACNNPLTGQHIGIYGQALTYDFELNGHGYQSARWDYGGGIDFNFKHALARVQLNIQASSNLSYIDETTVINSNTLTNFYTRQYSSFITNIDSVGAQQLLADTEESIRVATGAPFWGLWVFDYTYITSENINDYWGTSFNTLLGPQSVTENIKNAMESNEHIREYWVNQMITNTSNTKAFKTQKLVLQSISFTKLYTSGLLDLNNTTANEPLWSNQTGEGSYNGFTIPDKAQNTESNRNNISVNGYGISTEATSIDGTYLVIPSDQIQAQITYRTVTSTPNIEGTYNNPTISTSITTGDSLTYTTTVPRNLTGNNTYTLNITIQ